MTRFAAAIVLGLPLLWLALLGVDPAARGLIAIGLADPAAWLARDPMVKGEALYAARRFGEAAEAFAAAGTRATYNRGTALARAGRLAEAVRAYDTALVLAPADEDAIFNRALVLALLERSGAAGADPRPGSGVQEPGTDRTGQEADDRAPPRGADARTGGQDAQKNSGTPGGGRARRQLGDDGSRDGKPRSGTGAAADADGPGSKSAELAAVAKWLREDTWRRFGKSYEGQSVLPTREWLGALPDDPGRYLKLRLSAEQARRLARGGSSREGTR
jgi:tetratricopeptide (TPR) repeat protein